MRLYLERCAQRCSQQVEFDLNVGECQNCGGSVRQRIVIMDRVRGIFRYKTFKNETDSNANAEDNKAAKKRTKKKKGEQDTHTLVFFMGSFERCEVLQTCS